MESVIYGMAGEMYIYGRNMLSMVAVWRLEFRHGGGYFRFDLTSRKSSSNSSVKCKCLEISELRSYCLKDVIVSILGLVV